MNYVLLVFFRVLCLLRAKIRILVDFANFF